MIHIESDEYYENYISLCSMMTDELCNKKQLNPNLHKNQLAVQQELVQSLNTLAEEQPETFKKLQDETNTYRELTKKTGFSDRVIAKPKSNILQLFAENLLQIITLPLYLLGVFNAAACYFIPKSITHKKVKDPQFESTFRYGLSLIVFIIFNILTLVPLVILFVPEWWMKLAYIIAMPLTIVFAFNYYVWSTRLFKRWKIFFLKLTGNKMYKELSHLRTTIAETVLNLH